MITNMTMKATGHISAERFYGDFVKIDNSRWRVYHPTGHVDITSQGVQTWMYYVRDRLGSTRAVITEQGVPLQATDYYPSGIPVETFTAGNAYNTTDRLHTGKEFHAFDGLSWHDNAARRLDNILGRFTAIDPLAEKYPDITPYASRANSPFHYVDLMGDSITVLLNPNGAGGFGHLAILIQNNEGKWQLYSKNGNGASSESSGEASKNDVAEGDYSSPQDFLNDDKRNPKDAKSGTRKYTEGFVIPATQTQDKKAINGAKRELKKGYNLLGSNCAKTVQTALENAGLNSGNPNKALSTIGLFGSGEYVPEMVPNAIYKNIKRYNSGFTIKPTR